MAEIKWIKLATDMFDNRKIKYLRKLPEGNSIVLIWIQLLTMAGRCNANGRIYLTENIPYTTKMLADELDFEENTILLALNALEQLGMIGRQDDMICITGWEDHQNVDGMGRIREQNRQRQKAWYDRQKALSIEEKEPNVRSNVSETESNVTLTQQNKNKKENKNKDIDYISIQQSFNSICTSLPQIRTLTDARKKKIEARLQTFSMEDIETAFRKAQDSDFLTGKESDWKASFDWLMKSDENIAKVLEGNYDNRSPEHGSQKQDNNKFHQFQQSDYDSDALEQALINNR